MLECVIEEVGQPIRHSVIWLHGLGADGHNFSPIVAELNLPKELGVRFIFPHAPMRAVTINNGLKMRAWYDIGGTTLEKQPDLEGIFASARDVEQLIEAEMNQDIVPERIVLAGFSQGCAMALHVGLTFPHRLAGIMGLSGYMPSATHIEKSRNTANQNTPIFLAHGTADDIISLTTAQNAKKRLEKLGNPISFHEYPMAHQVCYQEVQDIRAWLLGCLKN